MNYKVLNNISYGVYVVSTLDGETPVGCIANSIMQVTSEPPTIAVSINHDNFTHKCMKENGRFAICILSEESDPGIIGTFGFQSGQNINKFQTIGFELKEKLPVIKDACGYILCEIMDTMETNTHTVFLANVLEGDLLKEEVAMTYAYYHNVVKGKSPKNAPTYRPEEVEKKESQIQELSTKKEYKCSVCGYVYDGEIPFEELPEDYICPICKKPKSVFVEK